MGRLVKANSDPDYKPEWIPFFAILTAIVVVTVFYVLLSQ